MDPLRDPDPEGGPVEAPAVVAWIDGDARIRRVVGAVGALTGDAGSTAVELQLHRDARSRFIELCRGRRQHTVLTGRRNDGLPLLLASQRLGDEGDLAVVQLQRLGGPVRWFDGPPADRDSRPNRPDIAQVLSHDARAALRHARNFSDLARRRIESDVGEPRATNADTDLEAIARRAVDTADEIVARCVEYLRLANRELVCREVSLVDVVAIAEQLAVRARPGAGGDTGIAADSADVGGHGDLALHGDAVVTAEPELLASAIAELVVNARTFAPGAVVVEIHPRDDGWVDIDVVDGGGGIAPDLVADAFEPGRMLQGRGTFPGTGMGLALARRIAWRHAATAGVVTGGPGTRVRLGGLPGRRTERVR